MSELGRLGRTSARVPGSGIREILDRAAHRGADLLRLEIGEPNFPTPPHIVRAAQEAAGAGVGYTQSAGSLDLRTAMAATVSALAGRTYAPEQIVVTQGGVQGCALVLAALLSPGDEVLIPDPAWPNFEMQALLYGARVVRYPLRPDAGFQLDVEDLARCLTDKTRVLILNSPSNPTGTVLPAALVEDVTRLAAEHGVVVLSDEVYDHLVFQGEPCNAIRFPGDHVVGVYSFSKTYAMTGWRIGYVAAPPWLAPGLVRLQEAQLSCVSAVSQAAAFAALAGPQDHITVMREAYRRRRDIGVTMCQEAGIDVAIPGGAFYLMFPFAPGVDGRQAALALIDEGVAVAPGTAFGDVARSYARLSLGVDERDLTLALERLISWSEKTDGGLTMTPAR